MSTDPHVMRVITRLNIGGPARQALYLTRSLTGFGFRTELLAGVEGPSEGSLSDASVAVERVPGLKQPISPLADLRAVREIARRMRARQPDIVHSHLAKAGMVARLAAFRTKVPVIVHTFHGHVLEGYFSKPAAAAFAGLERRLARKTDALIAVSTQVRDDLIRHGIGSEDRWRVIPVGLELDHLLSDERSGSEVRKRLGLPKDGPLVGSVGRLVPIKDHDTFLEAAVRVHAERPDAYFVVAGDGELRGSLENRARSLLKDRVIFLGWVTDLPALYRALDVVVVTSRNEGTPTALIEAAAASRPIVATRVGGVPDVVRDGETGILTRHADPTATAAAILAVLSDKGRAERFGTAGRAWVGDRFTAARLTANIADLYGELLEGTGAPVRRLGAGH